MTSDSRQKTQAAVDALHESLAACDLVMVADVETGLVLCTDTASSLPHDTLERLSDGARADLVAPWVAAMAKEDQPVSVARINADGHTVALRPAQSEEIVICRCPTAPDRETLDKGASVVFDVLSSTAGG